MQHDVQSSTDYSVLLMRYYSCRGYMPVFFALHFYVDYAIATCDGPMHALGTMLGTLVARGRATSTPQSGGILL